MFNKKRPAFLFYPADWSSNANLSRCSWAARGAWIAVLGVLHKSDEYGLVKWPLQELILASSVPKKLISELIKKGVLKGSENGEIEPYIYTPISGRKKGDPVVLLERQKGPIWYSTRMIRDNYIRKHKGESNQYKTSPMGGIGEGIGESIGDANGVSFGEDNGERKSDGYSLSVSKKEKSLQKEKSGKPIAELLSIPKTQEREFLSGKEKTLFENYLSMRAEAKMKTTSKTIEALQDSLLAIKSAGHDIAALLKKATQSGWRSFEMPKEKPPVRRHASVAQLLSEPEPTPKQKQAAKIEGVIRRTLQAQNPNTHVLQIFNQIGSLKAEAKIAATNGHGAPTELEVLTLIAKNLKIDLKAHGVELS